MLGPSQMGLKKTTAVFSGVRKLDIHGFVSLDAAFTVHTFSRLGCLQSLVGSCLQFYHQVLDFKVSLKPE